MSGLRAVKVFVSSPGDVGMERVIVGRVLDRLQGEFLARLKIEPVFWENEAVRATADYQSQFPLASTCDIVVCVLWSRLGTRLPDNFGRKPDGSPWQSGTEFEFEDALQSYRERKLPDLLVFRKTEEATVGLSDDQKLQERREQKRALDQFLENWFGGPGTGFKAGFTTFSNAAEFEEKILTHLRKLLEEKLPPGAADAPRPWWHAGSPFRGLEPFEAEHAPVFFGRTRAISAVRDRLVQQAARGAAFLLLVGASGTGKSSLLGAGVVPVLTHPGVVENVDLWRVAFVKPGAARQPCEALAAALEPPDALPELLGLGYDRPQLTRLMRDAPQVLDQPVRSALRAAAQRTYERERERWHRTPALRLLLVVDQFEELFTTPGVDDAARGHFIRSLAALANSGRVWVIAAARSDFYHRCLEIPELAALKEQGGQYDLLPPTPDELRQIIVEPARAAGLRFETSPEGERLDAVLLEAATRNPGTLPLLEFALEQLYQLARSETLDEPTRLLTHKDYNAIGGLEGALARHAEETLNQLPERVKSAFDDVMSMAVSVTPQGRAALPIDLRGFPAETPARELIDALVDARLMMTESRSDGAATARLVHDALLTHWRRLADWAEENEELLRIRGRVEGAWRYWLESQRDSTYLLAEGKPLADGRRLLEKLGSRLDPDLVEFVRNSIAHVLSRRRAKRRRAIATTALFMAVVAGAGIWIAWARAAREANKRLAGTLLQGYGDASAGIIRQVQPVAGVDPDGALNNSEKLIGLFDQLTGAFGEAPELHAQKGELLNARARVYSTLADVAKAEELAQAADGEFAKASQGGADSRRWQLARGRNLADLCAALYQQYRFVEGGKVAGELLEKAEAWRRSRPDDLEFRNLAGSANRWKGLASYSMGDGRRAREFQRRAVEELRDAAASVSSKDPLQFSEAERETLRVLARTLLNYSDAAANWETPATLKRWCDEALKLSEMLETSAPGNGEVAVLLADARMASVWWILDSQPDAARRLIERVLQDAKTHSRLNPNNSEWRRLYIYSSFLLGDLSAHSGGAADEAKRLREAIPRLQSELKFAAEMYDKYPRNRIWWNLIRFVRGSLSRYYLQSAQYDSDSGNGKKLREEGTRLRELADRMLLDGLKEDPDNWVLLASLKATAEPRRFDLWIDHHRRRQAREPDNPSWTAGVAEGLARRGSGGLDPLRHNDSDLQEALRLYDSLAQRLPGEWQWASRAADVVKRRYILANSKYLTLEGTSPSTEEERRELEGRRKFVASLVREGLRRYQDLAAAAPEWREHHERLFYFRWQLVGSAREREAWAEAEAAMTSALDDLLKFYAAVPEAKAILTNRGAALGSVRAAGGEAEAHSLASSREIIHLGWTLTHMDNPNLPRELRTYRRVDGILSILNAMPEMLGTPALDRGEARSALRLARAYLGELGEMNYRHSMLDVWREAIETALAGLSRESHPIPPELQGALDRMDYRRVVGEWLNRGADPRDVLRWLDSEARLARQATWRRQSLLTLLFLPDESAQKLLDAGVLDSMSFGPAPRTLSPEALALLQCIAFMGGDFFQFLAVSGHGAPSGEPVPILLAWIRGLSNAGSTPVGRPGFVSRSNLTDAAALASVDVAQLGARVAPRVHQLLSIFSLNDKFSRFEITDDAWKELEAIRSDQAAPAGTRIAAAALRGENLLFKGEYVEARKVLHPLLEQRPDSRPILQDLVLLDLLEGESAAPGGRQFPPLADLRVRLLESRYPGDPLQQLLVAWWNAEYRGRGDVLEKVRPITQNPDYQQSWLTYDLLAHVAEAEGKPNDAKAFLKTTLEKVPDNQESRPIRERLKNRLNRLERAQ